MEIIYQPYIDPEYECLIERIYPPWVCIDNDTCKDCTLVKVDSANKHGILLEMVQVLTDLDLVISKSYISSDGGWFMDVFHVTDQLGNKITDESIILYIQQALCAKRGVIAKEARLCLGKEVAPGANDLALEMTTKDRPGLMSEISAVLVELGCNITAAVAWTHSTRAASIFYVEDGLDGGPITDPIRLANVQEQLENVIEAHHEEGEKRSVRLTTPAVGRTHTERRLHQLMYGDDDYEMCRGCDGGDKGHKKGCDRTHVSIESCKEKGYWIVNVRSKDRPKLLFDTVCALTDLEYVVFHALVSSGGTMADQEYFVRHKDGYTLNAESERQKLTLCLVAAIERRISEGLRLDLCAKNRMGLLSDITRVFRESGLSISRVDVGTYGERAVGSIYVTDASGHDVNLNTVELVTKEIGGSAIAVHKSQKWAAHGSSSRTSQRVPNTRVEDEGKPRPSFGSLLWAQLERLSSSFGPIRS
ncbi:putative [Protein-PII] uridylyltransferase [Rosa chinensis]|uniref:ACT domain-containing protein ACR n=1 Tax=Rosa chinensis TaxID=74649 RepID=A0A2P6RPB5_ROSCH|nr:ACT domain-containing protein ACR1 isoform X1 [Rosa chinensis]XP_040370091.1 ACT domain-containing protein ACR1 isoform X1 [Rosa chinensis]XP_040370093.1 ACT domain-containing protein ACR1 isoform X1 [Rosa chinensis]PRQ48244.1 putative [Protein-PII] uridylyltransferase [Rosa chinensis]